MYNTYVFILSRSLLLFSNNGILTHCVILFCSFSDYHLHDAVVLCAIVCRVRWICSYCICIDCESSHIGAAEEGK